MESETGKKRSPRKNTFPFLVAGPVPGLKDEICEWTSAMNEGQALLQIRRRLEKKYRIRKYLGGCRAIKQN